MAAGGLGGVECAHEAGFAGDAAAAHDEDMRGAVGAGIGNFGEAPIGAPGQVRELRGESEQGKRADQQEGSAHQAEKRAKRHLHGSRG